MVSELSNEIESAGMEAKYDKYCKILLANKVILGYIMKYCIKEFADYDPHYIAENCIDGKKIVLFYEKRTKNVGAFRFAPNP